MFFRFNKDGDFYWKLIDLGGGSGTFLNGSKCVPHVEYSLKTKDIIGVATSDEESVREGDNTTFVYEIMSPTSILENCRKFGVEESIIETEKALSKNRKQERYINEKRVINNMKDNPKVLFDYIKKQNDKDIKIGPFKIGEEYIDDSKELCKILVEQYNSQYSRSRNTEKISNEEINNIKEGDLIDIVFSEDDIVIAINKLNKNSAAGPDWIPSIFLINTKESIKIPLKLILRKSIDEGVVPDVFKMAYVAPVYKGGSKLNPANFRPVSLTSHVMKVFERVLKVQLVGHLVENDLLKNNQHGFIAGRSTQTQLLQHYSDEFEALI